MAFDAKEAGFTDADDDGQVDGTGTNADGTVSGSDGYTTPADVDGNNVADYKEVGPDENNDGVADACDGTDTDGDGIADAIDTDDDNDGILDSEEGTGDTDNDGTPDYKDTDSDGDGCSDAKEAGFTDADEDGQVDGTGVNADGTVTDSDGYTSPLDGDANNKADYKEAGAANVIDTDAADVTAVEATDAEFSVAVTGATVTYAWEMSTDGVVYTAIADDATYSGSTTNVLTITGVTPAMDGTQFRVLIGNPSYVCDASQYSSVATLSVTPDRDQDGIDDATDTDNDNDGIPDAEEGTGDTDNDGIPDYLDVDSDNDGIYDVVESGNGALDTNNDGVIDGMDAGFADADNNGQSDNSEGNTPKDSDGDGISDHLDLDSDNDGIYDMVEGGDGSLDTNNDGMIDAKDAVFADADGDGAADAAEATGQLDSDNDGVADHLDIDSDNDGIYDVVEGGDGAMDSDGNGMLNSNDAGYIDIDNDGAMDGSEITTVVDTDNDGTADYIDTDSDNDGCNDTKEAGFTDIEGDGILGGTPIAVDAMGKVTTSTDGYTSPADADANEVADYQEVGAEPVLDANASDVTVTENTEAVFTVAVTASNDGDLPMADE